MIINSSYQLLITAQQTGKEKEDITWLVPVFIAKPSQIIRYKMVTGAFGAFYYYNPFVIRQFAEYFRRPLITNLTRIDNG
jgi:hypothetical protein